MSKSKKSSKSKVNTSTIGEPTPAPVVNPAVQAAAPSTSEQAKKPVARLTRFRGTLAANITHFGQTSDRDGAYCAFYLSQMVEGKVDIFTMRKQGARNPLYAGSNLGADAGAINRLRKAVPALATVDMEAGVLLLTDAGTQRGENMLAKLAPKA